MPTINWIRKIPLSSKYLSPQVIGIMVKTQDHYSGAYACSNQMGFSHPFTSQSLYFPSIFTCSRVLIQAYHEGDGSLDTTGSVKISSHWNIQKKILFSPEIRYEVKVVHTVFRETNGVLVDRYQGKKQPLISCRCDQDQAHYDLFLVSNWCQSLQMSASKCEMSLGLATDVICTVTVSCTKFAWRNLTESLPGEPCGEILTQLCKFHVYLPDLSILPGKSNLSFTKSQLKPQNKVFGLHSGWIYVYILSAILWDRHF